MPRKNLESVAEAFRYAKKRVPKSLYYHLLAGVERGLTRENNALAFDQIAVIPRLCDLKGVREQATTVLGQGVSMPIVISPTGVQAVDPEGEVAVARAAKAAGILQGLSNYASQSIGDVIAANDKVFFQLYWFGDREAIRARVERAHEAGAVALAVTLDWALTHRADWGRPQIPEGMGLKTLVQHAGEGLHHPGWVFRFLRSGGLPTLEVPNARDPRSGDEKAPSLFSIFQSVAETPPPTWDDMRWLREIWDGPLMIKGVMHIDDARRAVDIGADAISVSNHGGNNIDTTPPSIRVLPTIAEAVGDDLDVLLDGGIRRGGDVVKALALGAKAVMIGRAYLMALAAGGEAGVSQILSVMRAGVDENLLALGKGSVHELERRDVLVPEGFAIREFPQTAGEGLVTDPGATAAGVT